MTAAKYNIYSKVIFFAGWSIPPATQVAVKANGELIGFASLGLPRPDVLKLYPNSGSMLPGWRFAEPFIYESNTTLQVEITFPPPTKPVTKYNRIILDRQTTDSIMTSFGGRHNRTSLRENLINKVIFSTADLTKQDCERIAEDDLLFSIAITNKNKCFLDYLSSFYSVHPMSVKEIIDRDIEVWVKGIKSTEGTAWDRPLRAKTIARFVVAKYNANIIEYINNLFLNNKGKRYLDVGCGTGLSLLSAIDAGFDEVIGYEYSAGYTTMSKCVTQIYKERDKNPVSYYDADYLTAKDKGKYDLITFFDVLEHISPAKFALSKAIKSLKKNGVIYAYQGNSYSPAMVLNEPHYGLPLLTLLPRSIVVNILMRSGRIQQESNYVVNSWPRLSEIDAWAREDKCVVAVYKDAVNLRNGSSYMLENQCTSIVKRIDETGLNQIREFLSDQEYNTVEQIWAGYKKKFFDTLLNNPEAFQVNYGMTSWNIVLAPKIQIDQHHKWFAI